VCLDTGRELVASEWLNEITPLMLSNNKVVQLNVLTIIANVTMDGNSSIQNFLFD
jgi:hypothetical protein